MNLKCAANQRLCLISVCSTILFVLTLTVFAGRVPAQSPADDATPPQAKADQQMYQTLYLANATDQESLNDIQTALRNMIPHAKIYGVSSEAAITMRGTPEEIAMAQKVIADLDRPRRIYRLTYTITDSENGQVKGSQHYTLVVASGDKTVFKQGGRVPIVTGSTGKDASQTNQVQYLDVGLNINAILSTSTDALTLHSKVELSGLQTAGSGARDPDLHQTVLEGTSELVPGKPLVLGSLDSPATSRHEDVEVVAELVR